jgi:hypothetical protein
LDLAEIVVFRSRRGWDRVPSDGHECGSKSTLVGLRLYEAALELSWDVPAEAMAGDVGSKRFEREGFC